MASRIIVLCILSLHSYGESTFLRLDTYVNAKAVEKSFSKVKMGSGISFNCISSGLNNNVTLARYNTTYFFPNGHEGTTDELIFVKNGAYMAPEKPERVVSVAFTSHDGDDYLVMNISNAQPEDSGTWRCSAEEHTSQIIMLHVQEPFKGVALVGENGPIEDNQALEPVHENSETFEYKIEIHTGNTVPSLCICLEDGMEKLNITSKFRLSVASEVISMANLLEKFEATLNFELEDRHLLSMAEHHGKNLSIELDIPFLEQSLVVKYPIQVLFEPKKLKCISNEVEHATITCSCSANPKPSTTLSIIDGDTVDDYDLQNDDIIKESYSDMGVYEITIISPSKFEDHEVSYLIAISNEHGTETVSLGDTDSGNTDSGDTDSGNTDSGDTDSGNTDSGDTDSATYCHHCLLLLFASALLFIVG